MGQFRHTCSNCKCPTIFEFAFLDEQGISRFDLELRFDNCPSAASISPFFGAALGWTSPELHEPQARRLSTTKNPSTLTFSNSTNIKDI